MNNEGPSEEEVARRLSFSAGALGAAGHEITDPYLLDLAERQAREELSGDEVRRLGILHILGR